MERLPNEVLEKIFSYCTTDDLIWAISLVNDRWRSESGRFKLWKNRVFVIEEQDTDESIISIVKRCPNFCHISFEKQEVSKQVLEAIAYNCKELRELRTHGHSINFEILSLLQEECPNLEYFDMSATFLSVPERVEIIGKFKNLKKIACEWGRCRVILKPISDGCPALEWFEAGEANFDVDDFCYFLLKKKDMLHTLVLPCSPARGCYMCTIPLLAECTALKKLCIHWNCGLDMYGLARTLGEKKCLKSLVWQDFGIQNDDDIACLFGNYNLSHLERLEFSSFFSYDDDITKCISENCPNLQSLHLGVCELLTDKTLQMLSSFKHLKELGIYGNDNITDEGMKNLLSLQHLKYLLLGGCYNLTSKTHHVIIELKFLEVLKFQCYKLDAFPWDDFQEKMKSLKQVDILRCSKLNVEALKQITCRMPSVEFSVDLVTQEWAGYRNNQFKASRHRLMD